MRCKECELTQFHEEGVTGFYSENLFPVLVFAVEQSTAVWNRPEWLWLCIPVFSRYIGLTVCSLPRLIFQTAWLHSAWCLAPCLCSREDGSVNITTSRPGFYCRAFHVCCPAQVIWRRWRVRSEGNSIRPSIHQKSSRSRTRCSERSAHQHEWPRLTAER